MKRSRVPQPSENAAEVVAHSGEDDVGGVAVAALKVAAAKVPVSLHVAMTASMAERRRGSRLMMPKTPRFLTEDEDPARIGRVVAAMPLSTSPRSIAQPVRFYATNF